jgi:RNA polymerase sigma-70 factor, ECF subfamily
MNKCKVRKQSYMDVEVAPESSVKLDTYTKAKIGQQLRAMYDEVITQGVPNRFAEILGRLDETSPEEEVAARKTKTRGRMAPPTESVRAAMLAAVPSLRAFAISLCGNVDRADDLVQEALLRAWGNLDSFEPGTNMSAWLFTILRNVFRSEYRKRRREVEDADGSYAESLTSLPGQTSHLEMDEFRKALDVLPSEQRESLILVGASGFSYEEAAQICGCAIGTIKSRVNRARRRLAELLSIESADDFGPDRETRAVVGSVVGS